jgi:hypothetical protein
MEVHHYIALERLAEGDREGARKHFRKCVATGCHNWENYDRRCAYLDRMKKDPTWPSWIPVKKNEPKP